jgi:hypothetical protein
MSIHLSRSWKARIEGKDECVSATFYLGVGCMTYVCTRRCYTVISDGLASTCCQSLDDAENSLKICMFNRRAPEVLAENPSLTSYIRLLANQIARIDNEYLPLFRRHLAFSGHWGATVEDLEDQVLCR